MRCFYCNKNEALKTYERIRENEVQREYYCLSCYEKLFLTMDNGEEKGGACPYCGTTIEEYKKSKLLGCIDCYKTLGPSLVSSIIYMQGGDTGHRGKNPFLSELGNGIVKNDLISSQEEYSASQKERMKAIRLNRQKNEIESLIAYLGATDEERANEYNERLVRMVYKGETEEEIVW